MAQETENFPSAEQMWTALVEIDTYLANDPDVWRIVSVCKIGEVLCDVLGAEVIGRINASVTANLCARCGDGIRLEEKASAVVTHVRALSPEKRAIAIDMGLLHG